MRTTNASYVGINYCFMQIGRMYFIQCRDKYHVCKNSTDKHVGVWSVTEPSLSNGCVGLT